MAINDPNYRYATQTWETDGIRTQYEIAFDGGYIRQSDVVAFSVIIDENGAALDRQVHALTFLSETIDPDTEWKSATVEITPALPVGRRVVIFRSTEKAAPLVNYTNDSLLTEKNLDLANNQAIFAIAEIMDGLNAANIALGAAVNQIVDLNLLSQQVYALILEMLAGEGITTVAPRYWELEIDGVETEFFIPGADISTPFYYDVFVDGVAIEPDDGFNVIIPASDTTGSKIVFTSAPTGTECWVVLRGYARALNSDYLQTILNSTEFLELLQQTITNTLYESTTVLELGPLKYLIPMADIDTTSEVVDGTDESFLLRCTNAADVELTVRANTGDNALDWETNPVAAPYFSTRQVGTGQVTIVGDSGVVIETPPGYLPKTRAQGSVITCTGDYVSGGHWFLSGDLAIDESYVPGGALSEFNKVLAAAVSSTSTTRATVTGWTFNVAAGKSYRIKVLGTYQTAATTTGGSLGILAAGGATGDMAGKATGAISNAAVATALAVPIYTTSSTGSVLTTTGVAVINTPHWIEMDAIFRCTANGTLSIQWGTEVASSAAQLNAGSALLVEEIKETP